MAEPPLLTLRGARVAFGGTPVFSGLELSIGRGDRICLVGRNGSGKSTLMKLLVDALELDAGERFLQPGTVVSYLPQDTIVDTHETVARHVAAGTHPSYEVDAMLAAVDLNGTRAMDTLSGGELRRAGLARAFIGAPDILLLDEPTNHLDLEAIAWLEYRLRDFPGAVLTVSHDRAFLTNVTRRILWLDRGHLRQHDQGFAAFEPWSEAVLEAEAKAAARLDVKIAEDTRWMLRGITARRKRNQGRLRKLEKLRAARSALLKGGERAKLAVADGEVRSRLVVDAKDVRKSFIGEDGEEKVIIAGFSTRILRGDRIGIIGPNGSGKTTLLRLLTGELTPESGRVRVAKALTPAYFDQRRAALDPRSTPWRTLCPGGGDSVMVQGRQRHVVGYLKDFLFTPDQAKSPIATLSGGERNRLLLAKILARRSDLLVLDEPTNDLDMDTLDLLQEMLADYPGTLILVSHDRDFLDRTVSSTIALEGDGTAVEYAGGYRDYLDQRKFRETGTAKRTASAVAAKKNVPQASAPSRPRSRTRLGYKAQRELDGLPARIAALGAEIARLEGVLADPALFGSAPAAFDRTVADLERARADLATAEERWLTLETEREALAAGAAN